MDAVNRQRATEQAAHEQALVQAEHATENAEAQRDRLAALAALSGALRETQHALDALDARNFGIAQRNLAMAERYLGKVPGHVDGVEPLRATIMNTDVTVAANLSDQRRHVATLVSQLDEIVGRHRESSQLAPILAAEVKGPNGQSEAASGDD